MIQLRSFSQAHVLHVWIHMLAVVLFMITSGASRKLHDHLGSDFYCTCPLLHKKGDSYQFRSILLASWQTQFLPFLLCANVLANV